MHVCPGTELAGAELTLYCIRVSVTEVANTAGPCRLALQGIGCQMCEV